MSEKKLMDKWQFWFVLITGNQYKIESIIKFDDLLGFHDYFYALPKITEIQFNRTKYGSIALFKDPIQPAFEHEKNKNGSRIEILLPTEKSFEVWEKLAIYVVGGTLEKEDKFPLIVCVNKEFKPIEINGINAIPKHQKMRIEIWSSQLISIEDKLLYQLRKMLELPDYISITVSNNNSKK